MMRLVYLPANGRWIFTFGDSPLRMDGEDLLFPTRRAALQAAIRHGLSVNGRGVVAPILGAACEV